MSSEILDFGIIEFTCDVCGETIEVECPDSRPDFKFASEEIKAQGWRILFDEKAKEFEHFCPEDQS